MALSRNPFGLLAAIAVLPILALVGCNSSNTEASGTPGGGKAGDTAALSGKLTIDGSGTVFPIVNNMGEDFQKANQGVQVTVNKSGTGSGFQKFARKEIDIATASRPITDEEIKALTDAGIEFMEVPIAYDGVTLIASKDNAALDKLTVEELTKIWSPGSAVKTWADIRPGLPAEKINFYGPTDNHGTNEYFSETITKKKHAFREDYQANQEYTAIVRSVAGDKNGLGYVGFNYYSDNADSLKAVPIDAGSGPVAPSEESIVNGTYTPLSRPLFLYVTKEAYARPEVKAFVDFALGDQGSAAIKEASYVPLPLETLNAVRARLGAGTTGTVFKDAKPGTSVLDVLKGAEAAKS